MYTHKLNLLKTDLLQNTTTSVAYSLIHKTSKLLVSSTERTKIYYTEKPVKQDSSVYTSSWGGESRISCLKFQNICCIHTSFTVNSKVTSCKNVFSDNWMTSLIPAAYKIYLIGLSVINIFIPPLTSQASYLGHNQGTMQYPKRRLKDSSCVWQQWIAPSTMKLAPCLH